VLNYFPRYKSIQLENYARVKFILHVPFRSIDNLFSFKTDVPFATFHDAFLYWKDAYSYNAEPDFLNNLPSDPKKNEFKNFEQKKKNI
jgi:ABC-type Zn2+ transport system substrate-binding protein/surface adhesin